MRLYILLAACTFAVNSFAANPVDSVAHEMDNVVVTGTRTRTDVRHLPYTVSVVGRAKLTENNRTNVLPTLVEQVPGLFVTTRGMMGYGVSTNAAGNISVRGLAGGSGQMMVLIDGHPQYQGVYGHSISDSYLTSGAERIEVLRGPASVLYGSNAMGGVMNIVTRGIRQDGSETEVNVSAGSYGTVQADATNQYRSGRFASTVSANYGRSDNHRANMGFEQYGGLLKLGYDLSDHWNASVNANITHFNASNPGPVSSPLFSARQWITRGETNLTLENHYGRTNGGISVYSNFGRHKVNDGTRDAVQPQNRYFRSRDALTGLSVYQSAMLFHGNRTTIGFDWQNIYGRAFYTSIATGEVLDTPNKQSAHSHHNEFAGYVDFRQDILPWLTIDAGLRLDHHTETGSEWIPQGGIVVRPTADSELKATVSKGFRNPTMREMYLYPPSNIDLEAERLMQYELAWHQQLAGGRFAYGINLYYIKGDNMIQNATVDGRPRNINTGAIENTGAEVEAEWHVNEHWSLNTNHSMLHMHIAVLGAPEYKGYLGANYRQGKWSVNAGLMQVAGLFKAVGTTEIHENFTLLNATVNYQLIPSLRLWLRGDNMLAQRYEVNAGFPMPRATVMAGVNVRL